MVTIAMFQTLFIVIAILSGIMIITLIIMSIAGTVYFIRKRNEVRVELFDNKLPVIEENTDRPQPTSRPFIVSDEENKKLEDLIADPKKDKLKSEANPQNRSPINLKCQSRMDLSLTTERR